MDTDEPNAACAATTDFGLRREAKRHAAFGSNQSHGKRCRRCAPVFAALRLGRLPPQSKSLSMGQPPRPDQNFFWRPFLSVNLGRVATELRKKNAESPRILIVDDDPGQRSLLNSFLRTQGFEPVTADSGQQALETLRAGKFGMMISDV